MEQLYYCTEDRKVYTIEQIKEDFARLQTEEPKEYGEMDFSEFFDMITDMGGSVRPVDEEKMIVVGLSDDEREVVFLDEIKDLRLEEITDCLVDVFTEANLSDKSKWALREELWNLVESGEVGGISVVLDLVTAGKYNVSDKAKREASDLPDMIESFLADYPAE